LTFDPIMMHNAVKPASIRSLLMDRNTEAQPDEWDGGDELPDIPDAGDDAVPLVPPDPIDISTSTLAADGAQLAGTAGDARTLYEQALGVFEDDRDAEVSIETEGLNEDDEASGEQA
jgi:hypothetical protein